MWGRLFGPWIAWNDIIRGLPVSEMTPPNNLDGTDSTGPVLSAAAAEADFGTPGGLWWATKGDINAFFGLMLDNLAGLLLMVALLAGFGLPASFSVSHMVPGTALGVMLGDLAFFVLALRFAKRVGRTDVTAMPLGLDTPSTFGMTLLVLGPAFMAARRDGMDVEAACMQTWHIGIWCSIFSGAVKLTLAPFGQLVRRIVPRAGLLGSLAAVALVLISFFPLTHILGSPLPGMLAMVIVLGTLIGHVELPGRTPGTLGALVVAGLAYYIMCGLGIVGYEFPAYEPIRWFPTEWLGSYSFRWFDAFPHALPYLPFVLPFALTTVVGGIDCTESAASAGDEYDTRAIIGIEAIATLIAGLSGGVIQTTPYIGHPAYKAMGGRAAYTLATALLIGTAGVVGYFSWLNAWIPAPVVYPILVFVGLEITSQTFLATPKRHYAAVAIACLPALAYLAMSLPNRIFGDGLMLSQSVTAVDLEGGALRDDLQTLRMLSNGFIVTGLLWAWMLASLIDKKLNVAAGVLFLAAGLTFFGIMHSPIAGNRIFIPFLAGEGSSLWLPDASVPEVMEYVAGYGITGLFVLVWQFVTPKPA
ncbi:putative MFS transporter, AGZA family, xanthine/uracil permease [Neorhodopirellula lusitana]|uniref:MFS transporter, AGZA family, xanthine/uracil permease n=2 Tax=Neorhodopirellula lusitana TaxID=445327 RepID=A0ABY1Q5V2_9BACT|nr:putative MFS transporter, AGZA family, xanthine/uracil permease [Neorhodopirellula lusitana]